MILFREFKTDDWLAITDAVEPFSVEHPLDILKRGVSVTAVEDGEIMACGGIVIENETEGTVWCKIDKKCLDKSYEWARTIREIFQLMMKSVGDLKISTYIISGFCRGEKLARFIGLKPTGNIEEHNGSIYYKYTAVI